MNISKKLKIQLNGNNYQVESGFTINKLLKRLNYFNNIANGKKHTNYKWSKS